MRFRNHEVFKMNKVIPEIIEQETLHALSYYPELVNVPIEFKFKKGFKDMIMNAQPDVKSMIIPLAERRYIINISRSVKLGSQSMAIEDLPRDVLVGWIGHELGHVMDYEARSFWGMIKFGLNYISSSHFVRGAERVADEYAIQHGLAEKIIETKNYILNHAEIPSTYKAKMRKLYLSPEEILELVSTNQYRNGVESFSLNKT